MFSPDTLPVIAGPEINDTVLYGQLLAAILVVIRTGRNVLPCLEEKNLKPAVPQENFCFVPHMPQQC